MWTLTHALTHGAPLRGATARVVACAALVVSASLLFTPDAAAAANREHQQIVADIRMLQEQTQQLQVSLGELTDVLKTIATRLDEQSNVDAQGLCRSEADHRRPDRRDPHRPREARRHERAPLVAVAGSRIAALVPVTSPMMPANPPPPDGAAPPGSARCRRHNAPAPPAATAIGAAPAGTAPPPAAPPAVGMSPTRLV